MELRLRVGHPEAGESLLGFAARLGKRNGWTSLQPFLNRLGLRLTSPALLPFDPRAPVVLGRAGGLEAPDLVGLAYPGAGQGRIRFRSHAIHRSMVVTGSRRVCPACLADSPIHLSIWDLSPLPVCPVHDLLLLSECPGCRCELDWISTSAERCSCGYDLRLSRSRPVGPRVAAAHRACHVLFEGTATVGATGPLAHLAAADLLDLMLRLGVADTEIVGAPQPTHLVRDADLVADLVAVGFHCLVPWPTAFQDFLARLAERSHRRGGRFGMRKEFGQAAAWLGRLDPSTAVGSLIGPEVSRFLDGRPATDPTRVRTGHLVQGAGTITLTEAGRRLGCSGAKLKETLRRAGYPVETTGSGCPVLVPLATIRGIEADLADLMDGREAARELGVGRPTFHTVTEALGIEQDTGPASLLLPGSAWSRKAMQRAIADRLPDTPLDRTVPTMRFGDALGRLVRSQISREQACGHLLGEKLAPIGEDRQARGVGRLLYAREDVDRLLPEQGVSIVEAGRMLGANSELAHLLVNRGLLPVASGPRGRRVAEAAIEAFRQTYVLPGQLGLDVGRHRGWAATRLLALGCRPVLGPESGSRQLVFLRSAVEGAIRRIR